ncbi:MAG TPA: V-type ATP synthase subunit E family protein [archaeon]|nr:V-type ATP synthase subunit E family protein [archaeon]
MALDDVVGEILAQAQAESQRIIDDGRKEAEAIANDAKSKAEARREEFRAETERMVHDLERMNSSTENLKANKMILQAKKDVVDEIFSQLKGKVEKMEGDDRSRMINKLLEKARKEIDIAFIYVNDKDKHVISNIKNLNLNGTINSAGGIIAENKAQEIRVDYTFETFLERLKEAYMTDVTKRIF